MAEKKKSEEIAPLPEKQQGLQIPPEWGAGSAGQGYLTSLDDSKPEGKMAAFRLITESGENINDYLNKEIELVGYLLTPAEFEDQETGELVNTVVTRLLMPGEKWIETHSIGVLKTLATICQFFGQPPWRSPVKVTPVRVPLRGSKSWIILKLTGSPQLPGTRQRSQG